MQAVIAADAGGGLCSMVFRLMPSHRLSMAGALAK
jgi:hypothetical protein